MYRDVAFIWEKIRLSRCTGTPYPYKRNRENNSKLSTSRDPGTPGRPSTLGSYKQALSMDKEKAE